METFLLRRNPPREEGVDLIIPLRVYPAFGRKLNFSWNVQPVRGSRVRLLSVPLLFPRRGARRVGWLILKSQISDLAFHISYLTF